MEVLSDTAGGWVSGRIVEVQDDGHAIVRFRVKGVKHQKCLRPDTQRVRLPYGGSPLNTSREKSASLPQSCASRLTEGAAIKTEIVSLLAQVSLFKSLPEHELSRLAVAFEHRDFDKGQVIVRQHDVADTLYIVSSGQVSVSVDGSTVATLETGDYFGENALLQDVPRCATVTADLAVSALSLTGKRFRELGFDGKVEVPKRQAVGGGTDRPVAAKPPSSKTAEDKRLMRQALKANKNIHAMIALDDAMCDWMIEVAWKEEVEDGEQIITEGDLEADYFYIVQEGTFQATLKNPSAQLPGRASFVGVSSAIEKVGTIEKGDSFGELALLYLAPRAATVTALTKAIVWVIDRATFKNILAEAAKSVTEEYMRWLDFGSKFFANMPQTSKAEFASALSEMTFKEGDRIAEEGDDEALYLIYDGLVEVAQVNRRIAYCCGTKEEPGLIGLRELQRGEPWGMKLTVASKEARCLHMDKDTFALLMGKPQRRSSRGRVSRGSGDVRRSSPGGALLCADSREGLVATASASAIRIRKDDLDALGLLGCGGFGAVILVQHRGTNDTFALKALSKGHIVKCGMQSAVKNERDIQLMCDSPFIVKLYETYNHDQSLFFLLELALGGELYRTYRRKGLYGSAEHARFYLAGVVFAFEHLHEMKVIHRDLKPENLLLTTEGRVKLADMGLAKVVVGKTFTTCGTPVYFAPEMISSVGHTTAVDWWTFGILAFELMSGRTPFEGATPSKTYAAVAKGIDVVMFPSKMCCDCKDFIKGMCRTDPMERLPMRRRGTDNIKGHRWFQGFDWVAMQEMKLEPPYKPEVKDPTDARNFCARQDKRPPQIPYTDDGTGWDNGFATN